MFASKNLKLYFRESEVESTETLMASEQGHWAKDNEHNEPLENLESRLSERGRKSRMRKCLEMSLTVFLYTLAAFALIVIFQSIFQVFRKDEGCHCGGTVEEAIRLGCKFDELEAAWLPDKCRDDELSHEFARLGPGPNGAWSYWADSNQTKELSLHEVSLSQNAPVFTTYDWHVRHCIYLWRKEHRSRVSGILCDPHSDTEAHAIHCGTVFMATNRGNTQIRIS